MYERFVCAILALFGRRYTYLFIALIDPALCLHCRRSFTSVVLLISGYHASRCPVFLMYFRRSIFVRSSSSSSFCSSFLFKFLLSICVCVTCGWCNPNDCLNESNNSEHMLYHSICITCMYTSSTRSTQCYFRTQLLLATVSSARMLSMCSTRTYTF